MLKLFVSPDASSPEYEALVASECPNCFYIISGCRDERKDGRIDTNVFLGYFTSHNNNNQATLKWRLTRVWRILRKRNDPDYEIYDLKVLNNLINALTECRDAVFKDEANK